MYTETNFLHCQDLKFQAFDINASQELFFLCNTVFFSFFIKLSFSNKQWFST